MSQLIFVKPRFDVYRAVSQALHAIFEQYTDLVEPVALDEAYLDVTENKPSLPYASTVARHIKAAIFSETNLTASAGVSVNKFLAKMASGLNKPNGLTVILPEDAIAFVEQLLIEKFQVTSPLPLNTQPVAGTIAMGWGLGFAACVLC